MDIPTSLIPSLLSSETKSHLDEDRDIETSSVKVPDEGDEILVITDEKPLNENNLSLKELKQMCKNENLNVNGTKKELISRLEKSRSV
tara:strand:+ start:2536 stop:2799 length:264 start_codon:yes stop_codon:yes gene_type:complete